MRISDWSSDVCSSDLRGDEGDGQDGGPGDGRLPRRRARMDEGDAEDRGDRQHHPFVIAIGEEADQIPPMRAVVEVKRSEEHTSELQSLMRISYAVFCLKKKIDINNIHKTNKRY